MSRAARCLSNLHQIAIGGATYAADSDNYLFPSHYDPGGTAWPPLTVTPLRQILQPYMPYGSDTNYNAITIYTCPSNTVNSSQWPNTYGCNTWAHTYFGAADTATGALLGSGPPR